MPIGGLALAYSPTAPAPGMAYTIETAINPGYTGAQLYLQVEPVFSAVTICDVTIAATPPFGAHPCFSFVALLKCAIT